MNLKHLSKLAGALIVITFSTAFAPCSSTDELKSENGHQQSGDVVSFEIDPGTLSATRATGTHKMTTNDDVVDIEVTSRNCREMEKATSTLPDSSITRAAINSKNYKTELKDVYVYAIESDKSNGIVNYCSDVDLKNDGKGNFNYSSSDNKIYWPKDGKPLDFIASNFHMTDDEFVDYDGILELYSFETGTDYDPLVALTPNQTKSSHNGGVSLQLKHLASQLNFYIANKSTSLGMEIDGIGVCGLYKGAVFGFDCTGDTPKLYYNISSSKQDNYEVPVDQDTRYYELV